LTRYRYSCYYDYNKIHATINDMDSDLLALLLLVVLVIVIVTSPPGPGTPRLIKVTI
jgi:hypothetical protein